jgi:hypothetical protein
MWLDVLHTIGQNSNNRDWRHVNKISLPVKSGKPVAYLTLDEGQDLLGMLYLKGPVSPGLEEVVKSVQKEIDDHIIPLSTKHAGSSTSYDPCPKKPKRERERETRLASARPKYIGGILRGPGKTTPQRSHHDFHHQVLKKYAGHLYIAFTPLTNDGYFIQVWPKDKPNDVRLLYIPYGAILILPGDTLHGGGFCTSEKSMNLRFHLYIYVHGIIPDIALCNIYQDTDGTPYSHTYKDHPDLENGKLSKLFV